jgi:DNA-binding NtrC family response regulator
MRKRLDKILLVDDDSAFLASTERILKRDFEVITASDHASALKAAGEGPDIVLLDIRLDESDKQNRGGMELLGEILKTHRHLPVVMFSAYGDLETAVECMRLGAVDFIQKPANINELRQRLRASLEHARLSRQVTQLEERLQQIDPTELIGESPRVVEVKHLIRMVAQDGFVTVLIWGETGTGKELVARAIHRLGWRAKEPFVPVAIAALNLNLVESELFGHEPGAFTGAKERRIGFIERAKRGVLFLDEIGDVPPDAQLKLLRFLEERRFARVGNSDEIEVSVQIVAATNRNLEEDLETGRIRRDLYYRLKSVQIFLPPLRERTEDIPLLVAHFLRLFREQGRTRITQVSAEALESLKQYMWPGNVRELKAVLERAVIYANYHYHQAVEKEDLPLEILDASSPESSRTKARRLTEKGLILDEELARLELSYMEDALKLTEGRKTEVWKLLGLNDRFAFLRRAKTLLKTYPGLASDYPTVRRLYGKDTG